MKNIKKNNLFRSVVAGLIKLGAERKTNSQKDIVVVSTRPMLVAGDTPVIIFVTLSKRDSTNNAFVVSLDKVNVNDPTSINNNMMSVISEKICNFRTIEYFEVTELQNTYISGSKINLESFRTALVSEFNAMTEFSTTSTQIFQEYPEIQNGNALDVIAEVIGEDFNIIIQDLSLPYESETQDYIREGNIFRMKDGLQFRLIMRMNGNYIVSLFDTELAIKKQAKKDSLY